MPCMAGSFEQNDLSIWKINDFSFQSDFHKNIQINYNYVWLRDHKDVVGSMDDRTLVSRNLKYERKLKFSN